MLKKLSYVDLKTEDIWQILYSSFSCISKSDDKYALIFP